MLFHGLLVVDLYLDRDITWVCFFLKCELKETECEACGSHPTKMLGAKVYFCDKSEGLAQKTNNAAVSLGDANEIQRRGYPFNDSQRCQARTVSAVQVAAHCIARAAGDVAHGDLGQGATGVGTFGESIEDLMRQAISRTRDSDVVVIDIQFLSQLDSLSRVTCPHHGQGHASGLKDGPDLFLPDLVGAARASVRVDKNPGALAACRTAGVGMVQQTLQPRSYLIDDAGRTLLKSLVRNGKLGPARFHVVGARLSSVVYDEPSAIVNNLGPEDVVIWNAVWSVISCWAQCQQAGGIAKGRQ